MRSASSTEVLPPEKGPGANALTAEELKDFRRLDEQVKKAAGEMVLAAASLYEIRDRRLYRVKFSTFEDYCRDVHEMSRHYANRLIQAGKIYAEMLPIVTKTPDLPMPRNEAQLRELGKISDPDTRVRQYRQAVAQSRRDGKSVTAALIRKVIRPAEESKKRPGNPPQKSMSSAQRLKQVKETVALMETVLQQREDPTGLLDRLRRLLFPVQDASDSDH